MPRLQPSLTRPTIRELKTFLFSSPKPPRHHHIPTHRTRALPTPRHFSHSTTSQYSSPKPRSRDRGPPSTEDTQTDFSSLNVLGNTPAPSTSIDACAWDGFHLDSGVKVVGGKGVLLVNGEVFEWCPWLTAGKGKGEGEMKLVNEKGQWEVGEEAWGLLGLVWPKPDLLILGLGKEMRPISPKTRQYINSLGIRVDIQDTRNAAAQFNLLATERGVGSVAAALIPIGWKEGVGVR
ncbi:hypothetical protein G7Y89_g99 [Cudoniella acicularis]|uniref:NADH dehydrogenase [ubiquinone] 1 alpha subcomplex assembly factor 3 n=1 Tax=Cudoniella acicularis TaxID=354080 RepID=A0A8H4RZD3_9HELO|nr:hypothetical protein G7Y89_g99 [Cudoniella acicularis]